MASTRSLPNAALCALLAISLGAGTVVLPPAWAGLKALRPGASPDDLVAYRLRNVAPSAYETAISEALGNDDPELAASVLMLADSRKVAVGPDVRERVQMAQGFDAGRSLRDAWGGLTGGDARSPEALAGAVTADLTGISDARDLMREGRAYLNNQPYSPLTMGLAVGGLVLTGATIASFGAATPARVGVTALKAADKSGLLSAPMRRAMTAMTSDLVDARAVKETVDLASAGDIGAARLALTRSVRAAPLAALSTAASDLGTVAKTTGYRAAHDVLKVADSPADISRLRRLATGLGARFRGALVVVGSAALTTLGVLASASGWLLAALTWLLAAVFTLYRIMRWMWRFARSRPRRKSRLLKRSSSA